MAGGRTTSERASHPIGLSWSDGRGPALSIVQKLAAAMTLPLLTVIVVLGLEVREIERESRAVRRQTALAVSADGPSRLLISLQDEQAWAIVELVGLDAQADLLVEGYDKTRRRTDAALAGLDKVLEDSPEETRRAFGPAMEGLAGSIEAIRRWIEGDTAPRTLDNLAFSDDVFERYGELIRPFFAGIEDVVASVERRELRQGAELIRLTGNQVTTSGDLGREVGVTALLRGGVDQREDIVVVSALRSQFVRQADAIRALSTGLYAEAGATSCSSTTPTPSWARSTPPSRAGSTPRSSSRSSPCRPSRPTRPTGSGWRRSSGSERKASTMPPPAASASTLR